MKKFMSAAFLLVVATVVMPSHSTFAESISLHTGNGSEGLDSLIHMFVGPVDGPFASVFTPADFDNARAGQQAFIVSPNGSWKTTLGADSSAKWISTTIDGSEDLSFGGSALYAIDFTIASPVTSATLEFNFLIDNNLGDINNEGLFINGTPLANSRLLGNNGDYFRFDQFLFFDISSFLNPGLNTLYINAVDLNGPAGLQFNAKIDYNPVPEPATMLLLASGLAGLAGFRKRFRKN